MNKVLRVGKFHGNIVSRLIALIERVVHFFHFFPLSPLSCGGKRLLVGVLLCLFRDRGCIFQILCCLPFRGSFLASRFHFRQTCQICLCFIRLPLCVQPFPFLLFPFFLELFSLLTSHDFSLRLIFLVQTHTV